MKERFTLVVVAEGRSEDAATLEEVVLEAALVNRTVPENLATLAVFLRK